MYRRIEKRAREIQCHIPMTRQHCASVIGTQHWPLATMTDAPIFDISNISLLIEYGQTRIKDVIRTRHSMKHVSTLYLFQRCSH